MADLLSDAQIAPSLADQIAFVAFCVQAESELSPSLRAPVREWMTPHILATLRSYAALQQRNEELERDAARYGWLRADFANRLKHDNPVSIKLNLLHRPYNDFRFFSLPLEAQLDSEIDAALSKSTQELTR